MKSFYLFLFLILPGFFSQAGNHGPCKVQEVLQSDSAPNYMFVKMACAGTGLATSCEDIESYRVTYDATTEVGKFRTSMILSAFAAGKDVRISTWGACPAEARSTPLVYGIIVY